MTKPNMTKPKMPWSVPLPVAKITNTAIQFDLTADETVRAAVARAGNLRSLSALAATLRVTRLASGIHVAGQVNATVGQNCVVSLEPIENSVQEPVDLLFAPSGTFPRSDSNAEMTGEDPPEPLEGDSIDLGAIAVEFLMLGIDPYPRTPNAVFAAPTAKQPQSGPFSALAGLKKRQNPT